MLRNSIVGYIRRDQDGIQEDLRRLTKLVKTTINFKQVCQSQPNRD